jgi:hypothetical protein
MWALTDDENAAALAAYQAAGGIQDPLQRMLTRTFGGG